MRPRSISVRGLLVVCQLNALARHHRAHLVEIARVLNTLTYDQRRRLGIVDHDPMQTYDRVERLFTKIIGVLKQGVAGVDAAGFANRLARRGRA